MSTSPPKRLLLVAGIASVGLLVWYFSSLRTSRTISVRPVQPTLPCLAPTKAPAHGSLGSCASGHVAHGGECSFACEPGFSLLGPSRYCRSGVLGGFDQICVGNPCAPPQPPEHAQAGTCTGTLQHGSTCSFTCEEGFELKGCPFVCSGGALSPAEDGEKQTCQEVAKKPAAAPAAAGASGSTSVAQVPAQSNEMLMFQSPIRKSDDFVFSPLIRKTLDEYTALHKKIMDPEDSSVPKRFLVNKQGTWGMGNKLESLVATFLWCILTNRALVIDWENDFSDARYPLSAHQFWEKPDFDWSKGAMQRVLEDPRHKAWSGSGATRWYELTQGCGTEEFDKFQCGDLEALFPERVIEVYSNQWFVPLFWNNPAMKVKLRALGFTPYHTGAPLFRFLLRPVPAIRRMIDEHKQVHFKTYNIGLQLRMTDSGPMDAERVEVALHCAGLMGKMLPDGYQEKGKVHFFVATDGVELRGQLRSRFGDRVSIFDRQYNKDDFEGLSAAIADIFLLSECDDMVISTGSTFGFVAHARARITPLMLYRLKDSPGHGYCIRQFGSDPCMHMWFYKMLDSKCPNRPISIAAEDLNGNCYYKTNTPVTPLKFDPNGALY